MKQKEDRREKSPRSYDRLEPGHPISFQPAGLDNCVWPSCLVKICETHISSFTLIIISNYLGYMSIVFYMFICKDRI